MRSLPPTLLLQGAVAMALAAAGVVGILVARHPGPSAPTHRHAWRLFGVAFLLMGMSALGQDVFGAAAILGGEGSAAWTGYMRTAPALNHSRGALELAMLALLLAASLRRERNLLQGRALWLLPVAMAVGAAVGWLEGPLRPERHYANVAMSDALNFALWAVTLSAAVLADVVDRWLLLALAICAVQLPLNSLWFFWLARAGSGAWAPRPFDMQLYRLAVDLAVVMVAAIRWRLARRGVLVDGLGGVLQPHPA